MTEQRWLPLADIREQSADADEPVISRLDLVPVRLLEVGQEGDDHLFRDVRDQQIHRSSLRPDRRELQEQFQCIPVTPDRVARDIATTAQVVLEE
jgi:hypothetical protein